MKTQLFSCIIAATLISCSGIDSSTHNVNGPTVTFKTKIDSLFTVYEHNGDFMGSMTISKNNEIVYSQAIGFDNVQENIKSTPISRYKIGSASKTFTATLIFKAIEENKLRLDQTIEAYVPNIKNANNITISNLLNHRSGIHSFTRDKAFATYHTSNKSPDEMLDIISKLESDFTPGSKGEYSNSNYFILAQILEQVYGAEYGDILEEKILIPLELKNTFHSRSSDEENPVATSYVFNEGWSELPSTHMSISVGSGSLISTSADLTIFMDALFNEKIISRNSLENMATIEEGYGMGIMRFSLSDRESFGHHGAIDGYRSVILHFPKENVSIALLSNGSNDNKDKILAETLKLYFADAVLEISETEIDKYAGTYYNSEKESDKMVFTRNKNVLVHVINGEFEEPLIYKGNHRFLFEQVYVESMSFTFTPDGKQMTLNQGDYEGLYIKE